MDLFQVAVMPVPFFLPTSSGDLSAIVDLPDESTRCEIPIVLFATALAPRIRSSIGRYLIQSLTKRGHPVFRLETPGTGLSTTARETTPELIDTFEEACTWLMDVTQATKFRIAGACLGARISLALAARVPFVEDVVAIDCPIRRPLGPRRNVGRVRAGLAAVDPIGTKLLPMLTPSGRSKHEDDWLPDLASDIITSSKRAGLAFVFSRENPAYGDFHSLLDSGEISEGELDRLQVIAVEGGPVFGPGDIREIPARVAQLEELLCAPTQEEVSG